MSRATAFCLRLVPLTALLVLATGARECDSGEPPPGSCEVDGVVYDDGTYGVPAPDGCNTCSCEDGVVSGCTEIACPTDGTCVVDGVSYPDGSSVPAADGCNTCSCDAGTVTACTEIACAPPGGACSVFGVSYDAGWAPSSDGCNTCDCTAGHIGAACTDRACALPLIEECTAWSEFPSHSFDLDAVRVDGDTLSVDVSYSGGCEAHFFRLCYEPGFLESFPVQADLRLEHDSQNDTCEAYLSETRQFDLRPIAASYAAGYGEEHATVILRIGDYPHYVF